MFFVRRWKICLSFATSKRITPVDNWWKYRSGLLKPPGIETKWKCRNMPAGATRPLPELPQRGGLFQLSSITLQLPHLPGAFPKPFLPLLCGGQWCSSCLLKVFEYRVRIKKNFSGYSHENLRKVVYITTPKSTKRGRNGESLISWGKKWGSLLFACQPISEPGIKPSSLIIRRHKNIAHFYLFFKSNGEFPGKKIPPKK